MSATTLGWLALGFALAGMLVTALGWRSLPGRSAGWVASAAIGAAFACAVAIIIVLEGKAPEARTATSTAFTYINTGGLRAGLSILVDPLSAFMIAVVTGVSFLIHVYSVSYVTSDRGFARYFAYLNFFVFSMLLLVLAANFIVLIVGWAFVGAASYLLISFWYRRTTATAAGIKAFVINVVGDLGLVIATFILFFHTGAVDYATVFGSAHTAFSPNSAALVAACLLLLLGAFAKSAQIPLHTWLPDAMEGPTPVSALIHAATMVTAGVYLIARAHPLFELAPTAADIGAALGTLSLVFAASVALVVTDLKRIIAYSTISQIGYMVLGVSTFAYSAGLFQLMTHAFFKALLFMGAGSVIAAMGGLQSIDRMGGFRRALPFTFVTFTAAALALAGFPLFSGFYSKDSILAAVIHRGGFYAVLGGIGYAAALLTAIYAFRMVFRVFFGPPVREARSLEGGELEHVEPQNPLTGEREDTDVGFPGPEHHVAERARPMQWAMAPLALLSCIGGLVAIPGATNVIDRFLEPTFADSAFSHVRPTTTAEWAGLAVGGGLAVLGIAISYVLYLRRRGVTVALRERFWRLHDFLEHKWYFDELFDAIFVRPALGFARFGRALVETEVVQGLLVGGATGVVRAGSSFARGIQSGYLRAYALLLLIGFGGLALYFLLASS